MKTYEEKLWNWLIKNFPEKTDARRIWDYVIRLNGKPKKSKTCKAKNLIE